MKKILHVLIGFGIIGAAIFLFDYGCVIRRIFHFPCPGCGMTRAWGSILKGNWTDAFLYHPLFWLAPILGFLILQEIWSEKQDSPQAFRRQRIRNRILIVISILFIMVYLVRVIFFNWRG